MRKLYIDNIRWITVVLVVLYHVIYMFNGIETFGVIGPFSDVQYQDAFQYIVYPWFMLLLFAVSGMSARYELVRRSEKEFRYLCHGGGLDRAGPLPGRGGCACGTAGRRAHHPGAPGQEAAHERKV